MNRSVFTNYLIGLVILAAGLGSVVPLIAQPPSSGSSQVESDTSLIKPDAAVQERIAEAIELTKNMKRDDLGLADAQVRQAWRAALLQSSGEYRVFIPQLVFFARHATDVEGAMAVEIATDALSISRSHVAAALIPFLEAQEESLRAEIIKQLQNTEDQSTERPPDFSHYRSLIEHAIRSGKTLPRQLIQYIMESNPGTGVVTVVRAHAGKLQRDDVRSILWAEHQVADVLWKWEYSFLPKDKVEPVAAEALAKLATHPQWWARYYVAEIMRRYPPFRTDELIELLAADPDESVRGVIEQITGVKVEPNEAADSPQSNADASATQPD